MAILAVFEEEELNRLYTGEAIGGPGYETGIVGNKKGTEQRTIDRYDAQRAFDIQFGGMTQPEQLGLHNFFLTKWGRAIGFRFYPPNDRNFQNDVIGIGDASTTVFYLRRNYASRTRFISRRIVKPVKDTVVITKDDVAATVTIDWTTGAVTFSAAPAAGTIIRAASGQYDLPVYFDVDEFNATDYGHFADWNSIKVVEILPSSITSLGQTVTPLTLAFTAPASNDFFTSTFDVTLTHTGVTKVYLYVDGVLFGSDPSSPFTFTSVPVPALTTADTFTVTALGVDASGHFVEAQIELRRDPAAVGTIDLIQGDTTSGITLIDGSF
jgi:uncharacterized protein (TIGR02217 family)